VCVLWVRENDYVNQLGIVKELIPLE
jgi:hypothetical protein